MLTKNKKFLALLMTVSVIGGVFIANVGEVKADAPYKTYTVDGYEDVTETQTAYLPYETISKIGDESLLAPTDFTILDDGYMYILDSGNCRVVVSDMEANLIMTFGEGTLVGPKGIYVTSDHTCYVADKEAGKIFVFDENGELINTYGKPDSAMYGETQDFLPSKIVVNESGTMYVVCESNTNGIVEISPVEGGTFLGYFGTNSTKTSWYKILWRAIQTDAQRAKSQSNTPATPDNLAIDEKGLIYTVTRGEKNETLKKLNIAGVNMIDENDAYEDVPSAVAVGNHDNIFVTSQMGYIYEYNEEGELLFVFGGSDDGDQRIGLSTKVEAIQVASNDMIYVLDSDKAQIQVYEPTEFTNYLHQALYLFSNGRYTEAKEPLTTVLEMNNLFDYANMAMGKCLYKEGNYEEALAYAKLAKDTDTYSDAYWEIRNEWLKHNLSMTVIIIFLIWLAIKIIKFIDKKTNFLNGLRARIQIFKELKYIKQLRYGMYFIKHPIDGSYGIKREKRSSVTCANILLVIFMIEYVINKYFCGFLIKNVREGSFELVQDIGTIVIALVLIVGCNYLMCTINDGEGRLSHIYISFMYCLIPYLLITPVNFILSHVVTENEMFFISLFTFIMYVWIIAIGFVAIMEINQFTVKENIKIIFLTLFTILIVCLLAFILYVLGAQVVDFIESIVGEAVYRIGS